MPKMKTHKGTKKRVKKTGRGKYKRYKAYKGHKLTSKSSKRKRRLSRAVTTHPADKQKFKVALPYE